MTDPHDIMRWFDYSHLPAELQPISAEFAKLADWVNTNLPKGPEKTVALRKLLEGKDAAVRAHIAGQPTAEPTQDHHETAKPTTDTGHSLINGPRGPRCRGCDRYYDQHRGPNDPICGGWWR